MAIQSLRPLAKNDERPLPKFAVCDIEASDWVNFLVIGYYGKDDDGKEIHETFQVMGEFCDWIFTEAQPNESIYAHFGGKYDFNFIMKEFFFRPDHYLIHNMIPRGSGLLCFSVSTIEKLKKLPKDFNDKNLIEKLPGKEGFLVRARTIEFRDSSALLPFSLKSITENFGVAHKKQEIDYEQIKAVTPELLEYLEYDLKGLYESLEKFYTWPMIRRAGASTTIASQAMRVCQTYLKKSIVSIDGETDDFVRGSYFGGRTEIFKPMFYQNDPYTVLRTYDVNSLYPAVMRDNEFPNSYAFETTRFLPDRMGFYDVEVEVPEMYVPPLGTVFDPDGWGRFIFPTGVFRGKWSSVELNYALTLGVKIRKVFRGMIFRNAGFIFKDYIGDLYAIRQQAKKDSVDNVLCKLLMNSTYGRFGLQREREQIEFDRGQVDVSPHQEIHVKDNRYIRLMKKDIYLENSFANVAISAWVTSLARILMHKHYVKAPEALYYTDTDSMFTTYKYPENETDLGQLKLEYKAKAACFLLPKTYIIDSLAPMFDQFDDKGKKYKSSKKVVMKGFDKKKISKFTFEDFQQGLEGDLKRLQTTNPKKFATFKTALKKQQFVTMIEESNRQIRSTYDKRRIVKRAWAQIYDTEPLHIKGGEIVNQNQ